MKATANYKLNQWDREDRIQMEDFNSDNGKVDAALAGLAGQVSTKAEQSALNAQRDEIVALTAAMALKGNCQVQFTQYTGNGSTSRSFTFPRRPLFITIMDSDQWFCAVQGAAYAHCRSGGSGSGPARMTWNGKSVSWTTDSGDAAYACNASGKTYSMIVLMSAEE